MSETKSVTQVGDDLARVVFERHRPANSDHRTSYQNDYLTQCDHCGSRWLHQFWEVETSDTEFEEHGVAYARWTELSDEDLAAIELAAESGERLAHNHFWTQGRPTTGP